MRNIFINNFRYKKKRANIFDINEIKPNWMKKMSVVNDGISNVEMEYLNAEIQRLPLEFQEPFMMYFNGYKYQEIAGKLNLPLGTIKSRIFLARKALKKRLRHL